MYYEYHRWYDPGTGRFISADPLKGHLSHPQTLNPYVYVTDMPTTATDPTGLDRAYDRCDRVQCNPMTTCDLVCKIFGTLVVVDAVAGGVLLGCVLACPFVTGGGLSTLLGLCGDDPAVCEPNSIPTTTAPPASITPPPAVTSGVIPSAVDSVLPQSTSTLDEFVSSASSFTGEFEYNSVKIADWAAQHVFERHIAGAPGDSLFSDIGYSSPEDILSGIDRALQTGYRVENLVPTAKPGYIAIESPDIPVRLVLNQVAGYWQLITAIPIPAL